MDAFIGLDVGTTGVKALVYDEIGQTLGSAYRSYELSTPYLGWVEQDAEDIVKKTWEVLIECAPLVAKIKRVFVGLSTQGGTLVLCDGKGRPLRAAITWMDSRAQEEAAALRETPGRPAIYEVTRYGVLGSLPLSELYWLKNHEPAIYRKIRRIRLLNDFIVEQLTGVAYCDPSNAGISMLYDINQHDWSDWLLEPLGLDRSFLSPVKPSGTLAGLFLEQVTRELGWPKASYLVLGGHDQYCASLSVGAVEEEVAHLSGGTAWAMVVTVSELWRDPLENIAVEEHVIPGFYGILFSVPAGGASLEWVRNRLSWTGDVGVEPLPVIDRESSMVPPGSDGVMFHPLLVPVVLGSPSGSGKGMFSGLALHHTRYHLMRSVMEGVVLETFRQVSYLIEQGVVVNRIRFSGGAARSHLWTSILAEVVAGAGITVEAVDIADAPAVGAASLAYLRSQDLTGEPDFSQTTPLGRLTCSRVEPDPRQVKLYQEKYDQYLEGLETMQKEKGRRVVG